MTENESTKYQNLVNALKWFDEDTRVERAKRIDWASSLYQSPGLVVGEIVPLSDLPGFSGPMISRKMAPNPRGAYEKKSIHGRADGHGAARSGPHHGGR
ncbi:MAG: hypothetical protein Q8K91_04420, partial [Hylemonella sp.]|nr:hypothetical protein [Hylemonella sp.]MDP1936436.1 hypothetical protein [Hylemonella sp.]